MNLSDKAKKIKVIVLDIDGVLTDGRFGYDSNSENEIKFFHARDGHGIKLAMRAGLKVGVLSGRVSIANRKRAAELGLDFCKEKCHDKGAGFLELIAELGVSAEECLYIGDDVIDARPMAMAGVAVVVNDGEDILDKVADFRTAARGGYGAVREVVNWLLKEQGLYQSVVMDKYFPQNQ